MKIKSYDHLFIKVENLCNLNDDLSDQQEKRKNQPKIKIE